MYLSGFSLTDCSFWHKLIRLLPLFQDIQPAVGRCPVRAELSARRRTTSWAPGPWKRQSRFLPASGRAFCALHPNLQTAGESLWPGGPPSEEEIYSLSSWKCDGKSVRAEKWNGGERVFRVPLHGWCASWFEAHTCTFDFWVQDKTKISFCTRAPRANIVTTVYSDVLLGRPRDPHPSLLSQWTQQRGAAKKGHADWHPENGGGHWNSWGEWKSSQIF